MIFTTTNFPKRMLMGKGLNIVKFGVGCFTHSPIDNSFESCYSFYVLVGASPVQLRYS